MILIINLSDLISLCFLPGKTPEYKPSPYKSEDLQEKKHQRDSKKKILAGPFRLNGPSVGDVFSKNPYEGGSGTVLF